MYCIIKNYKKEILKFHFSNEDIFHIEQLIGFIFLFLLSKTQLFKRKEKYHIIVKLSSEHQNFLSTCIKNRF